MALSSTTKAAIALSVIGSISFAAASLIGLYEATHGGNFVAKRSK